MDENDLPFEEDCPEGCTGGDAVWCSFCQDWEVHCTMCGTLMYYVEPLETKPES